MNNTQQLSDKDFAEAGAADALFDDEATVLAQPVVPLDGSASDAPEELTVVAAPAGADGPGLLKAARRPTVLALALVSALVGAVIGGTALYLFQRPRTAPAQTTAPAPPQSAEAATTTTVTAPVENQQPAPQNSEQPPPPTAPQVQAQDSRPAPDAAATTRPAAVQDRQTEAEARREHEGDDDRAGDRRRDRGRGRVDDDGEERYAPLEQAVERPRRRDGAIDTQAPILDDASPASRRAARVEEALRRIEDNRRARRARRVGVIH